MSALLFAKCSKDWTDQESGVQRDTRNRQVRWALPGRGISRCGFWTKSPCDMSDQMRDTELPNNSNSGSKRKYGSSSVRKRVSQACDQCRKKKLKCDGLRPICTACASLGRQCCYGEAVKKRGLPEGYVRGLEKLLGMLLAGTSSLEDLATLFESAVKDEAAAADLIRQWSRDESESKDTLPEIWRGSKLCKHLDQLLPLLDDGDNKGQEAKKPRLEPHSVGLGRALNDHAIPSLRLPHRDVAEDLFHIYFTYTNCWLPIIGKDEMLAGYYQNIELSETSMSLGERAALWAVLAYTECQRSPAVRECHGMAYMQPSPTAESYYEKARSLIPYEGSDIDIGHVQALLVLCLMKLAMGQLRPSWLLISQAITIAIDVDINSVSESNFRRSIGRSKHVILSCFCLDTLLATCLQRRPHFRREDALVFGFVDETGLEEWGHLDLGAHQVGQQTRPSRSLSIFNHLVRLVCILNDVALDRVPSDFQEQRLEYFRSEFNRWKVSLPVYCSLDASLNNVPQGMFVAPHLLNLGITFLICTEISERRFNPTTETLSEERVMIRQAIEVPNTRSASGSTLLPPIFSLVVVFDLGNADPSVNQLVTARASTQAESAIVDGEHPADGSAREINSNSRSPSDPHTRFADISKSQRTHPTTQPRGGENFPAGFPRTGLDPSIDSTANSPCENTVMAESTEWPLVNGLQSIDATMSVGQGSWITQNSPLSTTTVASLGGHLSVQENAGSNPTRFTQHPDTYSAALELFHFAQSNHSSKVPHISHEEGAAAPMDNSQAGLLISDSMSIEELALDPVLQNTAGIDDYFFELSNLDHL